MPRVLRPTASSSRSARSSSGSPPPRRTRSPSSTPFATAAASRAARCDSGARGPARRAPRARCELGGRSRDQRQIGVAGGELGAGLEVEHQIADLGARRADRLRRLEGRTVDHHRQRRRRRLVETGSSGAGSRNCSSGPLAAASCVGAAASPASGTTAIGQRRRHRRQAGDDRCRGRRVAGAGADQQQRGEGRAAQPMKKYHQVAPWSDSIFD